MPRLLLLACFLLLAACAAPAPRDLAQNLGRAHGFHELLVSGPLCTLYTLVREGAGKTLTVYIEGDGHAFASPTTASDNPTPHYPCALHLAIHDPGTHSICYLARPGQYLDLTHFPCQARFWTDERFSEDVVQAMDKAVDMLKAHTHSERLVLVGYSGGGTLAALLAQRRKDVVFLATAAGNLALDCWLREKDLTAMPGALDPLQNADTLSKLPQRHLLGSEDRIIPQSCSLAFCTKAGARLQIVPGFSHNDSWQTVWNYDYDQ